MKNLIEALDRNFTSPNVSDSNFESANIVDALDSIASAIFKLAKVIENKKEHICDDSINGKCSVCYMDKHA
jgi:histidine ammonia-lyase